MNYQTKSRDGVRELSLESLELAKGMIHINGEITAETATAFERELTYLEQDAQVKTITIIINSPGGSVNAGLAIYDMMQIASKPIRTVCVSMAASMGAILFLAGPKGDRWILSRSKVMLHEPLIPSTGGSATTIKHTSDSINATKEELVDIIVKHTGKRKAKVNKDISYDHYFTAKEAIEYGLCDHILDKSIAQLVDEA